MPRERSLLVTTRTDKVKCECPHVVPCLVNVSVLAANEAACTVCEPFIAEARADYAQRHAHGRVAAH